MVYVIEHRARSQSYGGWGFEYKTQAIWDKEMIGLGLIFRNRHEVLLYGSRGNPPKPDYIPPSVFRYGARSIALSRLRLGRRSADVPGVR